MPFAKEAPRWKESCEKSGWFFWGLFFGGNHAPELVFEALGLKSLIGFWPFYVFFSWSRSLM